MCLTLQCTLSSVLFVHSQDMYFGTRVVGFVTLGFLPQGRMYICRSSACVQTLIPMSFLDS